MRLGDPKAGTFKWGMKPEEVMAQAKTAVEAKYEARIDKARQDPGLQQRIRDELQRELAAVKKSYTKFEGQKSGWDVSIIGPEFQQNTSEAVLVTKEDIWTRYFFFFEDGLYKMFLGFNKDAHRWQVLPGVRQEHGGQVRQRARGLSRRQDQGRRRQRMLDHYEWSAGGGDRLRLIDRSEFYGVYCLVLYDGVGAGPRDRAPQGREPRRRQAGRARRRRHRREEQGEGLRLDDDIIDRVVGKETKKPGTEPKGKEVVVDASNLPKAASSSSSSGGGEKKKEMGNKASSSSSSSEEKDSGKKKSGKKGDNPMDGLEL